MNNEELARFGIQRREDNYPNWKHPDCAFRIPSRRRFQDHNYKHAESIPLLLAYYRRHGQQLTPLSSSGG